MTQSKFVRMKMTTYRRLRANFKGQQGESAAKYFERLSKFLDRWELNEYFNELHRRAG